MEEIAKVWGDDAEDLKNGLMVREKSVPDVDEDAATIAVEAARNAIKRGADPRKIGALYVGSESHPYAVKPTGTIVAEAIEASPNLTVADFEFACKAGTAAIQVCMGWWRFGHDKVRCGHRGRHLPGGPRRRAGVLRLGRRRGVPHRFRGDHWRA